MKSLKIESTLDIFDSMEALPLEVLMLMQRAIEARKNAYAPYSEFNVGAALLLDNNEIITGSNQENASYPSGLCAERTAVYYAASQYPSAKMLTLAIVGGSQLKTSSVPIPPCGACRQAIAEYEMKQASPIAIYFMGETGQVLKSDSLKNLLPFMFDKSAL
ncbi:cytidine deaminase [Mariniflexile ostreae]|uniref:Cytidine deaminase n=1 Tax=Mariniflexile ostreae TaxID=1520892 RepID=A0ABV5FDR6_9FLAO